MKRDKARERKAFEEAVSLGVGEDFFKRGDGATGIPEAMPKRVGHEEPSLGPNAPGRKAPEIVRKGEDGCSIGRLLRVAADLFKPREGREIPLSVGLEVGGASAGGGGHRRAGIRGESVSISLEGLGEASFGGRALGLIIERARAGSSVRHLGGGRRLRVCGERRREARRAHEGHRKS